MVGNATALLGQSSSSRLSAVQRLKLVAHFRVQLKSSTVDHIEYYCSGGHTPMIGKIIHRPHNHLRPAPYYTVVHKISSVGRVLGQQ